MIIKHDQHIFFSVHEVRKGLWDFYLDCAFRMLIGWAGKLRSRDLQGRSDIFWLLQNSYPVMKKDDESNLTSCLPPTSEAVQRGEGRTSLISRL